MVITNDIILKGKTWEKLIDDLAPIFRGQTNRTVYNVFILCLSIGIMYDCRLEKIKEDEDIDENEIHEKTVPRNVIVNAEQETGGRLDYMFQAAILSTKKEKFHEEYGIQLDEEFRLQLAFGDDTNLEENKESSFTKMNFLTQYANYGATILSKKVGSTVIESMENIKKFLSLTVEGNNFEINEIPDDIWFDEME